MQRIIPLKAVNPHLMCVLCGGYLINATTIIECLHSFCKTCILRYLETSYNCPVCDTEIHKTKPLMNIRSDPTLQEIVYKLVPGLYEEERNEKQRFSRIEIARRQHQSEPGPSNRDDAFSNENDNCDRTLVTFRYFKGPSKLTRAEKLQKLFPTRYLCCPSNLPIRILKKFVRRKFDLPFDWEIDIWRGDESLLDYLTLKDIIRIYGVYRERKPLELHFSVIPTDSDVPRQSGQYEKEVNVNVPNVVAEQEENGYNNISLPVTNDFKLNSSFDNDSAIKSEEVRKRALEDIANITPGTSSSLTSTLSAQAVR